ncbi:MAG: AMP-binding protein [Cyclobacteriaceae bacterium]|nr:AMP-binding protein [Cyclobacteriaceae bacterium]
MTKDFPWFSKYPAGIPHEIGPLEYQSLIELFKAASKKYKERVAYENMGATLSFAQTDELSTAFAAYLQKGLGLKKGDRIAIQMPNVLQFPVAFIGALKAGLIVVNTNPLYTPREMEHQFKDAGVSAVIILENFASHLEQIMDKIPAKHVIVTSMGDMLGMFKGALVNFVVRSIKKMVPAYSLPGVISFKQALKKGHELTLDKPEVNVEDIAVLQYTGGTTGVAKGAQLSHRNIIAHNMMVTHWFKPYMSANRHDIMITAIPMYHIFGLTVNGVLMYSTGVKSVLITNPRDIPGFAKELKKHKFTIMTGVNTLFNSLLHNEEFKKCDFSYLHGAIGGAMAVQDAVANKWEEVTGTPVVEGYGLSETSPVLCCNPLDSKHRRGTIGIPMPSTEVAIFDDDGNQLPQGQTGEICARGPQVMRGYWQKDNEGVFFHNEWFRTGDIGLMDSDGFFKIVDRKKDMIKVSGFNVFPNEIENVLASHPKVLEVAAIGVPDAKSGEVIKAFIVKKDPSLNEEELKKFSHENLTNYKVPKYFEFRTELPKTNVGKILRRSLKEQEAAKAA